MSRSLVVAALVTFNAVCAVVACGPGVAEGEGEGDAAEGEGEALTPYELHCASCHGADAAGTDLAPQIQRAIPAYATFVVRNGHDLMGFEEPMPAFSTDEVSDDDLADILAFVDGVDHGFDGAAQYTQMCFNCHGAPGAGGGRVREDLDGAPAFDISELVREGHHEDDVSDDEFMPAFTNEQLSDAEVAGIIEFLNP